MVSLDTSGLSGAFAAKNVGAGLSVTASGLALTGAQQGDYRIASIVTSSPIGTITPATLTITGEAAASKVYDGTTVDPLNNTAAALQGVLGADIVTLGSPVSGTFATADAGSRIAVTATGYTISSADAGNYILTEPSGLSASITRAPLVAAVTGTPTKTYDGNTVAALTPDDFTLSGFVSGQSATVTQGIGTYAAANAGAEGATASLASGNFNPASSTLLSNYALPTTAAGIGQINQAPLTGAITGTPTKTYDGNTVAALTPGDFTLSGFVSGQSATVTQNTGTYAAADAGAEGVTASLGSGNFTPGSGTLLSNYVLPTIAAGFGTINQASLTAAITGTPTKTYDGNMVAALTPDDFTLSGFIAGQGATVIQSAGTYAAADAGAEGVTASLASGNFTPGYSTLLSNYALPTSAAGIGQINQALLTGAITGTPTKIYDGNTVAALTSGDFALSGFVSGQSATINQTTGVYGSANAGSEPVAASLGAGDFVVGGTTNLSNYTLPTSVTGIGTINQAVLTAAITGTPTKTYDGNMVAALTPGDFTLSGFVSGQGATVTQSAGAYAAADAGAEGVTASLGSGNVIPGSSTLLSNYALPTSAAGIGQINQAALTAAITGTPTKTYDGNMVAALTPGDFTLSGFVSGQGATVTQSAGAYAAADAGAEGVTASLASGSFNPSSGTSLSNYALPTSAAGIGQINQAALTAAITGTPTKTYDGNMVVALTPGNFTLSGFVSGQGATVTQSAGAYAAADAGAEGVTASLASGSFNPSSGTSLSNYALPITAAGIGQINQALLTAAIIGSPTKTYDGNTLANLVSDTILLSGLVPGQTAGVTQYYGAYASANAGREPVSASLAANSFLAGGTTNLSNYVLPTSAVGVGTINQAILTASITGTPTKLYDDTTTAILTPDNFSLSGFVGREGASVTQTVGAYAGANAGPELVSAVLAPKNFDPATGTLLSNYVLPISATGAGQINRTPLSVTAQIIGNPTKTYDGGTAALLAPGDFLLSDFVAGQGATVTKTSGTYASPDAGVETITTSLTSSDFLAAQNTNFANYILPTLAVGTGTINQAILSAIISDTPVKTYDGNKIAALTPDDFTLSGFVSGQGATVTQSTGTYASADAGLEHVIASLSDRNFAPGSATLLLNYALPTSATGTGRINQARLTAAIIGRPTKTYDGSTNAALTPGDFTLSGFVAGQGATVTQKSGTYTAADAGAEDVVASLTRGSFTPGSGTLLSNYALPISAAGTGAINQAALTIAGVSATNKMFDGNRTDTLDTKKATLLGVVGAAQVNLSSASATGAFASASVGGDKPVAVTGFTISGADAANYTLLQPTGLTANISPSTLAAAVIGNLASQAGLYGASSPSALTAAIAGVTPVIDIPFPAPSGLSTRAGSVFGSLPVIIGDSDPGRPAASDSVTLSSNRPLIVSPEEILLQGIKDKIWHITLPPAVPIAGSLKPQD